MPAFPATDLNRPVSEFTSPVDTVVRSDQTIAQALEALRQRTISHRIFYLYAVDASGRLVGVIPIRSLILADPHEPVERVMKTPVISILATANLEEALELFAMHRLLAIPVIDAAGRLIGAVDVEVYAQEMFDLAEVNRVHDLVQLVGMSAELSRHQSAWMGFRLRMPWLALNLLGGLICAVIAWFFSATLERVLLLALFIPLVLTLSESISMQSMTLSLQLLHAPGVPWAAVRRRLSNEWRAAGVLGAACAAVVGGAAMLWGRGGAPGVIAASILITMAAAATLGVVLPTVIHRMRLDPKVASGPLVLMVVDIVAMSVYLGLATFWL